MRGKIGRAAVLLALALAACGGGPAQGPEPGLAPALVVERFLQAANRAAPLPGSGSICRSAEALELMARLFGTVDGPVLETRSRESVDRWMCALASVLKHDDYEFVGEGVVPGRTEQARQYFVRLQKPGRAPQVPITVVRTRSGSWLVEQIDTESAIGRR